VVDLHRVLHPVGNRGVRCGQVRRLPATPARRNRDRRSRRQTMARADRCRDVYRRRAADDRGPVALEMACRSTGIILADVGAFFHQDRVGYSGTNHCTLSARFRPRPGRARDAGGDSVRQTDVRRRNPLIVILLLLTASLAGCSRPHGGEVVGVSGARYTVLDARVLTVANGDRAFVVKYRGSVDVPRAFAAARDLAPLFRPEVLRQQCQGLVITAVEDVWRIAGFSRNKTYAVVFSRNADGSWTEVQPK